MKKCGIYKIIIGINNKVYVGKSKNIAKRKREHRYRLRNNIHYNPHLQFAWNKYGEESFQFEIIEECKEDKLKEREEYWINYYQSCDREKGYNIENFSNGNFIVSEETRKKLRESNLGKHPSEETRKKMSESRMGEKNFMFGKTHTKEARKKISDANSGKVLSSEHKKKLIESNTGRVKTKEERKKIRESHLGKSLSEETRKKIRESHLGKTLSEEHRKKIGDGVRGRFVSLETRKKISENNKGEKNFFSKLTWEQVREIRRLFKEEQLSIKELGKLFNTSQSNIGVIINNKSWIE